MIKTLFAVGAIIFALNASAQACPPGMMEVIDNGQFACRPGTLDNRWPCPEGQRKVFHVQLEVFVCASGKNPSTPPPPPPVPNSCMPGHTMIPLGKDGAFVCAFPESDAKNPCPAGQEATRLDGTELFVCAASDGRKCQIGQRGRYLPDQQIFVCGVFGERTRTRLPRTPLNPAPAFYTLR